MEPVRTCLGCRQRASRSELVRIVARDGRAVVDTTARLPGRGAWVHPAPGCVASVIRRNALGRALRVTGALDASELSTFEAVLEEQAERHMDN
jgi:predicted RNA-binding protein YlxR (DUF448 family)